MQTIAKQLSEMAPGDSVNVFFPQGFTVDYTRCEKLADGSWGKERHTAELARMNAWYWDEDDHCTIDHYYYDAEGKRFAKNSDITEESRKKISQYIHSYEKRGN